MVKEFLAAAPVYLIGVTHCRVREDKTDGCRGMC